MKKFVSNKSSSRRLLALGALVAIVSLVAPARADEHPGRPPRCLRSGTFVSDNGDIPGKNNPAEYTCSAWDHPRDYVMRDREYNCCSGRVVLSDPKDYWRSNEWDGCGEDVKAYNWDEWDVYCY